MPVPLERLVPASTLVSKFDTKASDEAKFLGFGFKLRLLQDGGKDTCSCLVLVLLRYH